MIRMTIPIILAVQVLRTAAWPCSPHF